MHEKASDIQILPSDQLVLPRNGVIIDTGVWMFAAGPQINSDDCRISLYSNLLSLLVTNNTAIYITEVMISEIFNFILTYFKAQHSRSISNKKYKSTDHYLDNIDNIYSYIQSITSLPNINFLGLKEPILCVEKISPRLDFNDGIYFRLCKQKNLTLVTDDGDFIGLGLPIITANANYLK